MNDLVKLRQRQKSPLDISLERMSKKTKERNDKFQNQEKVDLGIQTIYDKIKFYPKTNSEKIMQKVNRQHQSRRAYHRFDQTMDDDETVISKVQSLADKFKKQQLNQDSHMDFEKLKPVKIDKDLSPGLNPLGGTVGTRKDESYFNYQVEN